MNSKRERFTILVQMIDDINNLSNDILENYSQEEINEALIEMQAYYYQFNKITSNFYKEK